MKTPVVSSSPVLESIYCDYLQSQTPEFESYDADIDSTTQSPNITIIVVDETDSVEDLDSDITTFNVPMAVNHNGDLSCCCCVIKGFLRTLYRNRVDILIKVKAIAGFLEMMIAAIVFFSTDEDACSVLRLWMLAWIIRLPLEMPLLTERINEIYTNNGIFYALSIWNVLWFIYGNYLMFTGTCVEDDTLIFVGQCLVVSISYLCFFMNWPCVGVMVHNMIGKLKPILPHLPHYTFQEFCHTFSYASMGDSCVICMNNYEKDNIITHLPCKHFFHQHCINTWLRNHNTCPMCRAVVPDDGWADGIPDDFLTIEEQMEEEIAMNLALEGSLLDLP